MEDTSPKPFVFVLMPFSDSFKDIYEVGIKAACKDAGAYCERVDEQNFDENILERVYNQISKADIIVSVMTGKNPNVFYETGYAHALNKRVILLTQDANDIPFDLTHYSHIVYGGYISDLKSQLESRIKWCIENPKDGINSMDFDIEFSINGVLLNNNIEIILTYNDRTLLDNKRSITSGLVSRNIEIGIHNNTKKIILASSYSISIILSSWLDIRGIRGYKIKEDLFAYNLMIDHSLLPDEWYFLSDELIIDIEKNENYIMKKALAFNAILRLYTEVGPKDLRFTLLTGDLDK